jgi:hypothetical protein
LKTERILLFRKMHGYLLPDNGHCVLDPDEATTESCLTEDPPTRQRVTEQVGF